jgi:[NiFe] hydrogenase assembly HybE family chaperone
MRDTNAVVSAVLDAFRKAAVEMEGLSIVNPKLEVAAVGFREWEGGHAGVVITPWFMNVVYVAPEGTPQKEPGTRTHRTFPAGEFEFLHSALDGVGPIESTSLFSPMGEFHDMTRAVEVAHGAVGALFTPAKAPEPLAEQPVTISQPTPAPKTQAAPSRRDLFRRAFALR